MAILKNPNSGDMSGKVGDLVFRKIKDKTVIATAPKNIKISDSPNSVKNRSHMKLLSPICKEINQIQIFKTMWNKVAGNNIIAKFNKTNKYLVGEGFDISGVCIAPFDKYFHAEVTDVKVEGIKIKLTFAEVDSFITATSHYKYMSAQGVIQLFNNENEYPEYIGIASKDELTLQGTQMTFDLFRKDTIVLEEYSKMRILVNLVFKDLYLEPTAVSENIYLEL